MHFKTIIVFLLIIFAACSGYRFKMKDNPFADFNIYSVSVPTFVNYSSVPNVSASFTKEVSLLLKSFPGLRIYPGEYDKADAVLLGIITSSDHKNDVFNVQSVKFTSGNLEKSIGSRNQFYVPTATKINLNLQLVLIKNPSWGDIKLLTSGLGKQIVNHPRIVFNETLDLTTSFSREVLDNITVDSGGVTNFTRNKALLEKSIDNLAQSAALNFKQVVLDAF